MATFKSDVYTGRVPKVFRGLNQGQQFEVTGVIKLKVGTVLTDGDLLKFFRIGENVRVDELILSCDGDLDPSGTALAGGIGYFQALNVAGTALVVDNKTGTSYTSPSDAAFAYVATGSQPAGLTSTGISRWVDGQSGLDNEFATNVGFVTGPVDIGIEITATGTAIDTSDKHIRLTAKCRYKEAAQGEFSGDLADAYFDRYGSDQDSDGLIG